MKKTMLLFLMSEMMMLFLSGCGKSPEKALKVAYSPQPYKDVTSSREYSFSSFTGTGWKTKVKVAVADVKRYTGAYETTLLVPIHFDSTDPNYTSGPELHMIAVLPVGTHLRIGRLMQDQGVWGGVQVEAILEDGTNVEKAIYLDPYLLNGNKWSRGPASNTSWDANPEMLEQAK